MTLKMFVLDEGGERFWYAAYSEEDAIRAHHDDYGWDEDCVIDRVVESPPDAIHAVGGDTEENDVPEGGHWDPYNEQAVATTEQWLADVVMGKKKAVQLWSTLF